MSPEAKKGNPEAAVNAPIASRLGNLALMTDDLPFSNSTIELMRGVIAEHPDIEPRIEQLECLDAIQEARVRGQERALVQMATGLGKTTILAADVKRFLEEHPDARVLFLCHQNDILDQARERFERVIGPGHSYGNFTGEGEKDYHEVDCLFASFQAMREWRVAFNEDEFDYVVVDESHHGKARTYEPTLRHFKPKFMVGVTATPDRHDLQNIREIFGEEIFRLPLEEAIARGLLATVDYRVFTDDEAIRKVVARHRHIKERLTKSKLNRTIFLPQRDEEMARIILERAEELDNPKRIIFCPSIEYAEEFAQYFEGAAPLHSKLPKWEQDKYIQQFKAGEINTILTVDMFNEGMDVPDANQIVFLRTTQSRTVFLQQLGRGLRLYPGKDSVQVLDFVANCDRLTMLDELWRNIKASAASTQELSPDKILRIDVGEFSFSEMARDILEILDEIQANIEQSRSWTAEDSIRFYKELDAALTEEHKKPYKKGVTGPSASTIDYYVYHNGGPGSNIVLAPFNGDIDALREAAGFKVWKEYTRDDLVNFFADVIERTGKAPTGEEFKRMDDAPAITQVRRHFKNYPEFRKAGNLRWLERKKTDNASDE